MSDYFKNVLLADESEIYLTYALISLTGPTLGVVVGTNKIDFYVLQN